MNDSERRTAIVEAAATVFPKKGFSGTTTAEIARIARISKRDLYRLFARKEDILLAMIGDRSLTLKVPPDLGRPRDAAEFMESLRRFGLAFVADLMQPHRIALYRLAAAEAGRTSELGQAIRAAGAGPVEESVRAFLGHCVGAGIIEAADARLAMDAYFGILIGQRLVWMIVGAAARPSGEEIAGMVGDAVEAARRILFGRGEAQAAAQPAR